MDLGVAQNDRHRGPRAAVEHDQLHRRLPAAHLGAGRSASRSSARWCGPKGRMTDLIYGLIFNVTIEDDAFVRQLVAAGVESAEIIEDQRQKRQVPIVVDVLVVGGGQGLSGLSPSAGAAAQHAGPDLSVQRRRDCALHRAARLAAHRAGRGRSPCRSTADRGSARRSLGPARRISASRTWSQPAASWPSCWPWICRGWMGFCEE